MSEISDKIKKETRKNLVDLNVPENLIQNVLNQMDNAMVNPNFTYPTWESFLPKYLEELWFQLSEDARIIAYIMACMQFRDYLDHKNPALISEIQAKPKKVVH